MPTSSSRCTVEMLALTCDLPFALPHPWASLLGAPLAPSGAIFFGSTSSTGLSTNSWRLRWRPALHRYQRFGLVRSSIDLHCRITSASGQRSCNVWFIGVDDRGDRGAGEAVRRHGTRFAGDQLDRAV